MYFDSRGLWMIEGGACSTPQSELRRRRKLGQRRRGTKREQKGGEEKGGIFEHFHCEIRHTVL